MATNKASTNSTQNNKLEKAQAKYQAAVNVYISECQIIWSRYNAMLVFNTLLFTGFGFINDKSPVNLQIISHLLPLLGLYSCFVWYGTAHRGFKWINYWISAANKLEEKYFKEESELLNPIIQGKEHKKSLAFPTTPSLALSLIVCVGIIYFILFAFQISSLLCLFKFPYLQ